MATHKVGKVTFKGILTCSNCGQHEFTRHEDGSQTCNNCGNPLEESDVRTGKHTNEVITDEHELARSRGQLYTCPACQTQRSVLDMDKPCPNCGYFEEPKAQPEPVETYSIRSPRVTSVSAPTLSFPDLSQMWVWLIAGAIGLVIILAIAGAFITHDVPMTITHFAWQRNIPVEQSYLQPGEGKNPPPGATITKKQEVFDHNDYAIVDYTHSTDYVDSTPEVIGTTVPEICSGPTQEANGDVTYDMCSDDIYAPTVKVAITSQPTPVYSDPTPVNVMYYWWTTVEWKWVRDYPSNGTDNKNVFWATPQIGTNEREGIRTESYTVYYMLAGSDDAEHQYQTNNYNEFVSFYSSGGYTAKVNWYGKVMKIVQNP